MTETNQLILLPLTYSQLLKYVKNDNSLETELGLNESSRTISKELKEALEQVILPAVADDSKNYLYSTIWLGIFKEENIIVGELCMYGEPNENGEIEIGYGTSDRFQNKGFMTEMVGGITNWLKTQIKVQAITASTEKTNQASFRVLEKNNFTKTSVTDTLFNWKLEVRN